MNVERIRNRNISIINEGLRLLLECKVPRFCSRADPYKLDHMQREWSERLADKLSRLLDWIEPHRRTLFCEEWGPVTWEFRKYFLLVYFEQVSQLFECGLFQLNDESGSEFEHRLMRFEAVVVDILTKDTNVAVRCWLFHYYGSELGMEGWQCRPGDIYSLVRLCHFLLGSDGRVATVQLGPRALSFVENFGKKLLSCRQIWEYQMMGLMLMNTVMRHTCKNRSYTHDAEEILELALKLVWNTTDDDESLWNVIYYSARSMRDRNPSLDDEIMRTLVALLNENEDDLDQSHIYLKTLIRLLLLDAPEVRIEGFEVFTVSGRIFERDEFHSHVMQHLQSVVKAGNGRFSYRWRLRIGQIIPKLYARFANTSRSYFSRYYLQGLDILVMVVMHPIGQTCRRQRQQATILNCLLNEMYISIRSLWAGLEQNPVQDVSLLQDQQLMHDVIKDLFGTVIEAVLVLSLRRVEIQFYDLILQMLYFYQLLKNLEGTLERLINAAPKHSEQDTLADE